LQTQTQFRLLVVRLGAMGDILHALPAVTALRQAHPNWVIDWVVEPRWQALLAADAACEEKAPEGLKPHSPICPAEGTGPRGCPAAPFQNARSLAQPVVDHLHFASTKQWRKQLLSRKTLREIKNLRKDLRAGDYDAVIDLQGAIRSAVVARLAGCRRVIGEAEPRERAARRLFTETVATRGAHVIEQDLELAAAIAGDDLKAVRPWLPVDPVAEAWANGRLAAQAGRAALINPGAGWGAKRWPVERYAEVANGLIGRGFRVLVNAGPGEELLANAIVQATGGAATPVTCSLAQLIALTRRVELVIAGDTGPLHLACALGRPVVGIYGPTDPSRNGPFGTRYRVLRSPESRRDHTRHERPEAGLLTIAPDDVLRAATELLEMENAV
jgi:heptosyltransferase-1